ncbi:MAG: anthranilate phosphoribosyltransferase [Planctomycetota bacterium]
MISSLLAKLKSLIDLTQSEMTDAIDHMMRGALSAEQIGEFLLALRAKGESVAEIAGAATAMRRHMTPIRSCRSGLLDTCGTGGDASGTFTISTAAALVTAAAGVPVAKHGNRSITSKTGSADVLAALGVCIDAPVATVQMCLDELGICFCFAPHLHPAMKHVAPVRRQLGVPTIFNLLGPLCNPASAPYQLLGVGRLPLQEKLAAALQKLGTERAVVVTGSDGLDEVTLSGATHATLVTSPQCTTFEWNPSDFGFQPTSLSSLTVADPAGSAHVIQEVLAGQPGPAREIVILNAAAALWTARFHSDLQSCASAAADAIDQGTAKKLLADFARLSHRT